MVLGIIPNTKFVYSLREAVIQPPYFLKLKANILKEYEEYHQQHN